MNDGSQPPSSDQSSSSSGEDGEDRLGAAINHLRRVLQADGNAPRTPAFGPEVRALEEWADSHDLRLAPQEFSDRRKGGQEHDLAIRGDRAFRITKGGIFGLQPGIELAMVSSSQDARRFHLWEATPLQYLDRLALQNQLVGYPLNHLEGVFREGGDLSIVSSQPAFQIAPATTEEIAAWFAGLDFERITDAGYYRRGDNLGVFDAHDRNLLRDPNDPAVLIPFDVIPCHPDGGFLDFIEATLRSGHALQAIRTTRTSDSSHTSS